MKEIELPNFYDDNKPLKIKLAPELSPSRNAQKYFTKYNKLKTSVEYVKEQLKLTNDEIKYFENLQNDRLSFKIANKNEIWLHVKDIPGSHVVIRSTNPSEDTILEAAQLAAYFSKGRDSDNVPVDYLPVKRHHKPNGAKPGFVIFTGQKTLYVTPHKLSN